LQPVGPIVGGVIGGVALVAAISFLIWFFARRRKNDDPAPQQSSQPEAEASYFNQTSFPIAKNLSPEPTVSPVSPRDSHYQTPPYSQNPGQSGIEMYKYSQNSPHPQYTAYSPPLTSHTYPGAIEVDGVSVKRNPS
jgi:cytoskeletal protein RodZ